MTVAMADRGSDDRRRRRHYAAGAGSVAAALLIVGFVLSKQSGGAHGLGVAAFGYGIGVAVAATFLALGWYPRRRKT